MLKQQVNSDSNRQDDDENYSDENIDSDHGSGDDGIDDQINNAKEKKKPVQDDSESDEDNRMLDINNLGGNDDRDEDEYEDDFNNDTKKDDDDEGGNQQDQEDEARGLKRQTDHDKLEGSHQLQNLNQNQEGDFEESPRPKGPSNGVGREMDNTSQKLDANEEARIEIAERVLISIVKKMQENGYRSIR